MNRFAAIGLALILAAVAVEPRPPTDVPDGPVTVQTADAPVIVSHTLFIDAAADLGEVQAVFAGAPAEAGFHAVLPRAAPTKGSAWRIHERTSGILANRSGYNVASGRLRPMTS